MKKSLTLLLPLSAMFSCFSYALYVPIDNNDALRNDQSIKVFYSNTADQYRIPSITQVEDKVLMFAERRYDHLAIGHDFKSSNLILRILDRTTGNLSSTITVQRKVDIPLGFDDANNDFKTHLMNPTSVYDSTNDTIHLFFNRFITFRSGDDIQKVEIFHTTSRDQGLSWSQAEDITSQLVSPCETATVGPGRALQIPQGEPNAGRIVIPMHTIQYVEGNLLPPSVRPNCSKANQVAKGGFKVAYQDVSGAWKDSNLMVTKSSQGVFGEPQIIYTNGTMYLFSRLLGEYEYDGSGLGYSIDQGANWKLGFNENGPMQGSDKTAFTGRFYTPTQPGLATDGRYIYYTTSVHYSSDESISNRREGWIHRIDPSEMIAKSSSPVDIAQPITTTGFSNSSTIYLGDNKIGVIWEEVQTKHAIKRIKELFYAEFDTRDFRHLLDHNWSDNGFDYHPTWNGSHHLLNEEILQGDKREQWNP